MKEKTINEMKSSPRKRGSKTKLAWIRRSRDLRLLSLSPEELWTLDALMEAMDQQNLARADSLAEARGITGRQLRKYLASLRAKRLIALYQEAGRGQPRIWMVNPKLGGIFQEKYRAELQQLFDELAGDIEKASQTLPESDLVRATEVLYDEETHCTIKIGYLKKKKSSVTGKPFSHET